MSDLYQRDAAEYGGSFAADKARMALSLFGSSAGTVIQSINQTYSQQVSRIWEIGSSRFYMIGGRTEGQGSMTRVIGPVNLSNAFYSVFGDLCQMGKSPAVNFQFQEECGGEAVNVAYTVVHFLITSVGFAMSSDNMMVTEQITNRFSSLRYGG